MRGALGFGLGVGLAIQAWRQFPPDGPVTPNGAALVCLLAMWAAYGVGRAKRGGGAVAIAEAHAEAVSMAEATAVQNVNVYVSPVPSGSPTHATVLDALPWVEGPRPEITADDLDGAELAELIPDENTAP